MHIYRIEDHFRSHLGDSGREVFRAGPITVHSWPDPDGDSEVRALVTIGMSSLTQAQPPPGRCPVGEPRTELFGLASREHEQSFARVLADLALYPERESTWLHWFHNLRLGGPVVPGSDLTSAFTDVPYLGSDFATSSINGVRTDILWVVPITLQEHEYIRSHGFNAFSTLFEEAEPNVEDFHRASTVRAGSA